MTQVKPLLVISAIVAALIVIAFVDASYLWLVLLIGLPVSFVIGSLLKGPLRPAAITAIVVYVGWMALVIISGVISDIPTNADECDGFCDERTGAWGFTLVVGSLFATAFAVMCGIIALFVADKLRGTQPG